MFNSFHERRLESILQALFGTKDHDFFDHLKSQCEWIDLAGGDYLFRQGDEGDCMYVLICGRLKVIRHSEFTTEAIGEISIGEVVGEMALLTGDLRSADVMAIRDSLLARISKALFMELIHKVPMALLHISKSIITRQNSVPGARTSSSVRNICLQPLSGGDLRDFVLQLSRNLQTYGPVMVLDSDTVNKKLQQEGIASTSANNAAAYRHLTSWLEVQEAENRFVIYIPDENANEWTKRCLRQADMILLLADGRDQPQLRPIERQFLTGIHRLSLAEKLLVIIHEQGTTAQQTMDWIEKREMTAHINIRRNLQLDIERLGRWLSGNCIGLVLSGGGAKGAAHIGVIKALRDANVPYDKAGGTSIGAIIAAKIAEGAPIDEIEYLLRNIFLSNPTSDFNIIPRKSLFKGGKLDRLLNEYFGDILIEDMWHRYFCVSCNLTDNAPTIHRTGSLRNAIRASISLPGIFPPALINQNLHVDGGVFNNLPIDIMYDLGAKHIIAVDLQGKKNNTNTPEQDKKSQNMSIIAVVMESSMLGGRYIAQQQTHNIGLYFNPPVKNYSIMDWKNFDQLVKVGYEYASNILEKENLRFLAEASNPNK